jgi:hypothetical protein
MQGATEITIDWAANLPRDNLKKCSNEFRDICIAEPRKVVSTAGKARGALESGHFKPLRSVDWCIAQDSGGRDELMDQGETLFGTRDRPNSENGKEGEEAQIEFGGWLGV